MNTNIEVLRELDELVEAARLLGTTQAKRLFGCHTDEDRRFERAMYESIDKHRAALLDWKAKQPAPPSTPVRVSWADFWIAQGDWPTANDYAAFEKAEQWLLAQQPAAARVDVTWPLSILEAGNWREVYMGTKHMRLEVSYPYEAWERLMAALAAAQGERDELAKDAAKYRWGINNARWIRSEQEAYVAIPVAPDSDLSCVAMRDAAIDQARGKGGKEAGND
jgi:hypothetical protein